MALTAGTCDPWPRGAAGLGAGLGVTGSSMRVKALLNCAGGGGFHGPVGATSGCRGTWTGCVAGPTRAENGEGLGVEATDPGVAGAAGTAGVCRNGDALQPVPEVPPGVGHNDLTPGRGPAVQPVGGAIAGDAICGCEGACGDTFDAVGVGVVDAA